MLEKVLLKHPVKRILCTNLINTFSTSDLSDRFDQKVDVVEPLFKHYGALKQGYGQITAVACFEDDSLVVEQVKSPGEGRALVIDGGGIASVFIIRRSASGGGD